MKKFVLILFLLMMTGCASHEDILHGIEDGKIYVADPIITIDEDYHGDFQLLLNGETIEPGHTVTENGDYTLELTTKKLWMEKTTTYSFSHDDIQPKAPSFTTNPKPVYFKEAVFDYKKEKNVSYETFLNGEPVDLSKPITEEGTHFLKIVATKNNGLKSERRQLFSIDNKTYTSAEVDTFLHFFFDNNQDFLPKIYKWTDTVTIVVDGNPTEQDMKILNQHIETLNKLLPFKFIVTEAENGKSYSRQIDMHFIPTWKFVNYVEDEDNPDLKWAVGLAFPTMMSRDERQGLIASTVLIGTDIPQSERNHVILHELIHSIGMYNHFEDDESSILYPFVYPVVTELNEIDLKMIEILYRKDLLGGMTKPDVERVLKPRVRD
ncbi:DUF2927 domain-containing protein [Bacillus sp. PS06]|uniref:DUF2927 domain-containing protein n=1 Tax=Bacillus sp. PS06 TaxID=2764176 RepID=UPI0017809112|nr:DUF2927 domain-containing protein [Bacillus sp. PS06]MBD8071149.1 DUF2927 domain-containing protein [Bacillus sp. PS06]